MEHTAVTTRTLPELETLTDCNYCGARVGWVRLARTHQWRPVDPTPHRFGPYVLLRDGTTVVDVRNGDKHLEKVDEKYEGPRFWDHSKTCDGVGSPTLRTIPASLINFFDELEKQYEERGTSTD